MTQVHVKWGKEVRTYPTIEMAARQIQMLRRLRTLDAFVMAFWDESGSKPDRVHSMKQKPIG